jgi:hypothetical protein
MGNSAFMKTGDAIWKKVAGKHIELFDKILGKAVSKTEVVRPVYNVII